jgi:plastocyanin
MRSRFRKQGYAAIAAGFVLAAFAAPAHTAVTTHVTVRMTEYHFRLSVTHVRKGTVIFTILNKGEIPHTFSIRSLDKTSPVIQAGKRYVMRVTFRKPGKYYYLCTVGAHEQYGMFGNLRVTK